MGSSPGDIPLIGIFTGMIRGSPFFLLHLNHSRDTLRWCSREHRDTARYFSPHLRVRAEVRRQNRASQTVVHVLTSPKRPGDRARQASYGATIPLLCLSPVPGTRG